MYISNLLINICIPYTQCKNISVSRAVLTADFTINKEILRINMVLLDLNAFVEQIKKKY